jgi:putative phosphoribosyl transferase
MLWDRITGGLRIKLKSRETAAIILSEILNSKYGGDDSTVLGVARGGILLADIIADKLGCEFDIVVPRKLCLPDSNEAAIGAIMGDGTSYLNIKIIELQRLTQDFIEREKARQIVEIRRRTSLYRPGNTPYRIDGKNIILIDDGAATGATLIATIKWLRLGRQTPKSVAIAVPIAPKNTLNLLRKESDKVEVITSPPDSSFRYIEEYYHCFEAVPDERVLEIMNKRALHRLGQVG